MTLQWGDGDFGVRRVGPLSFECELTVDGWRSVVSLLEHFSNFSRRSMGMADTSCLAPSPVTSLIMGTSLLVESIDLINVRLAKWLRSGRRAIAK